MPGRRLAAVTRALAAFGAALAALLGDAAAAQGRQTMRTDVSAHWLDHRGQVRGSRMRLMGRRGGSDSPGRQTAVAATALLDGRLLRRAALVLHLPGPSAASAHSVRTLNVPGRRRQPHRPGAGWKGASPSSTPTVHGGAVMAGNVPAGPDCSPAAAGNRPAGSPAADSPAGSYRTPTKSASIATIYAIAHLDRNGRKAWLSRRNLTGGRAYLCCGYCGPCW